MLDINKYFQESSAREVAELESEGFSLKSAFKCLNISESSNLLDLPIINWDQYREKSRNWEQYWTTEEIESVEAFISLIDGCYAHKIITTREKVYETCGFQLGGNKKPIIPTKFKSSELNLAAMGMDSLPKFSYEDYQFLNQGGEFPVSFELLAASHSTLLERVYQMLFYEAREADKDANNLLRWVKNVIKKYDVSLT